jgi:hypothetical protein
VSEQRKFTLAQSLEARTALAAEVASMLDVAAMDLEDMFSERDSMHTMSHPNRLAQKFAALLVDRLLWSADSGLILDYDPNAEFARNVGAPAGLFSAPAEADNAPLSKVGPVPPYPVGLMTQEEFLREYIDIRLDNSTDSWYSATCDYCGWETDGSEPVVEEAAYQHAQAHIDSYDSEENT